MLCSFESHPQHSHTSHRLCTTGSCGSLKQPILHTEFCRRVRLEFESRGTLFTSGKTRGEAFYARNTFVIWLTFEDLNVSRGASSSATPLYTFTLEEARQYSQSRTIGNRSTQISLYEVIEYADRYQGVAPSFRDLLQGRWPVKTVGGTIVPKVISVFLTHDPVLLIGEAARMFTPLQTEWVRKHEMGSGLVVTK